MPTWRSLLFVPVNVEKFIDKAPSVGADAVQLELEEKVMRRVQAPLAFARNPRFVLPPRKPAG